MRRFLIASTLLLACLTLPRQLMAQYNNWAFGIRVGEPSGVNIRKYFGDNRAFDLNVGTYGGLYGNVRDYRSGKYKTVGVSIQGHYLWHNRVLGNDNIRGYYGFGGQINSRRYYPDRFSATNDYENALGLGGSAVTGLEYFIPTKQYSIFAELGIYAEVLPAPLFLNVSSGIGLRLNL